MRSVETSHDREVGFRHRTRQVVHTATADAQDLRLPRNAFDHRLALSKPVLLSAPSKKSFSSVSSPIFACSDPISRRMPVHADCNAVGAGELRTLVGVED